MHYDHIGHNMNDTGLNICACECIVFFQISAWVLIFYRASKTRQLHVNESGRLFEAHHLFLIFHFEGAVDLRHSLIAAHLHGLWALPPGDFQPWQRWPSFALQEHFLWSGRVVSSIWRSKKQWFDEHWRGFVWQTDCSTNGRSLNANFAVKLRVHAVCEAHSLWTPVFIWNAMLISYWAVKPPVIKRHLAFIQIQALIQGNTVYMNLVSLWLSLLSGWVLSTVCM